MKISFTILVLTLLILNACAQNNKDDAGIFFKSIVKTYFERDCDKFSSFWGDSATIISPYGVKMYSTHESIKSRKACEKFWEFTIGIPSFQHYIDRYKIIVLDNKEFTSINNDSVLKKISAEQTDNAFVYEILQENNKNYSDHDFLIFGNIHKSDSKKNIDHGLFWMIVRKTKHGWKIFGTKA